VSEADVARLAALLGLPLEAESVAIVAERLTELLDIARLFAEFPLPADVEPPSVFRP
jgi:hypothetical protein